MSRYRYQAQITFVSFFRPIHKTTKNFSSKNPKGSTHPFGKEYVEEKGLSF
jgi:hypothetical protein